MPKIALGLDFGTESVRALLVDLSGRELGTAAVRFRHGQITSQLPVDGARLPADYALQHPGDWIDSATRAIRRAVKTAGVDSADVISIGVDFTSCTMLPTLADGTPLCLTAAFAERPLAWPKLWKHHGAKPQTERINTVARRRNEAWLGRYGGTIGLEWFFPKLLETLEEDAEVYDNTAVWLEAGDWFVWQLVGGSADSLPRSTCQAGYKAIWNSETGYPSRAFLKAVHPGLSGVVADKMPGQLVAPGQPAGELSPAMARKFGLPAGIAVSAAVIDAHAGVPGAGVAECDTLVMVLGTSSCHMLNSQVERLVPGVAGIVAGGILPGVYGYETGQAAVGDAFDWCRRLAGRRDFKALDQAAAQLEPGAAGVACLDWFNGCRTPLMDGRLTAQLAGLTLAHRAEHVYRAVIEATAFGLKWIVDVLVEGGVPVKRFVATGGLPHHNPLVVQIYADVLGKSITVPASSQGPALGAAILGVLAAGRKATGFRTPQSAIRAMARPTNGSDGPGTVVRPNRKTRRAYERLYEGYRRLAREASARPSE